MNAPVFFRPLTWSRDPFAELRLRDGLARLGNDLAATLGASLQGLVLVGSLARGEAAACVRGGRATVENDVDLVAVVERPRRHRRALEAWSRRWSDELATHVEMWPVTREGWRSPPNTLFWLDVCRGGARVLVGDEALLEELPKRDPSNLPLEEASRLLANRATGVALSRLGGTDARAYARHLHKAALAAGDARLLAVGRYAGSIDARLDALVGLSGPTGGVPERLVEAYEDAIRFRRDPTRWRPRHGTDQAWREELRGLLGRWHVAFEGWRGGRAMSLVRLVCDEGSLFPTRPRVRGGLRSLQCLLEGAAGWDRWLTHHPAERLARASIGLAYGDHGTIGVALAMLGTQDPDEGRRRLERLVARGS